MAFAPKIMGVLNLTPDSFSDGGAFFSLDDALKQIDKLVSDGADIIDIGAESSKPGSDPVSAGEEWRRLKPILSELQRWPEITFSLDTYKEEIIRKSFDYNISIINNIKGLVSEDCLREIASKGLSYVSMHISGDPKNMQKSPIEGLNACEEVFSKLYSDREILLQAGFKDDKVFLDPGIGFGKDDSANLHLLKRCMQDANRIPLLLGVSRKSFMGRLLGLNNVLDRDPPSKMLEISLMMTGVKIIRTHEVKSLANMKLLLTR